MSSSGNLNASKEKNNLEPDYFGLYAREIEELLSHGDSNGTNEKSGIIGSTSLFSDGLGAQISELKRERLKVLLQQSISSLKPEVDEFMNPVLSVCRIRSRLKYKEGLLRSNVPDCKDDPLQHPQKKQKSSPMFPEKKASDGILKNNTACRSTGPHLPTPTPEEVAKDDDDLQFILQNDASKVEELLNKHSSELSETLNWMGQKLEAILNNTVATCREMTIHEKQHLRKLIQKLPPKYLDRIADTVEQNRPSDEVYVDLDLLDNVTLWRLYFQARLGQKNTDHDI